MHSIGNTIKCLRKAMGITQEELAQNLGVTYQAVSKWENDSTLPDVLTLPKLAAFFSVTIDELLGYKLNVMTNKERFIDFMVKNKILCKGNFTLKNGAQSDYYINTEQFTTNAQISKLGEIFADTIRENHIAFDTIVGLAYHGIGFSAATAVSLYHKYGITTQFCYDRQGPDNSGRILCGHTLLDGEKIILVDDLLTTGHSLDERITRLRSLADVKVAAILVIIDRSDCLKTNSEQDLKASAGAAFLEQKYNTKVYSLLTDRDLQAVQENGILL